MISISSGLKSRTSQRCRNNCLTVEMENGALANYLANRNAPHHAVSGGGGMASDLMTSNSTTMYVCYNIRIMMAPKLLGLHRMVIVRAPLRSNETELEIHGCDGLWRPRHANETELAV